MIPNASRGLRATPARHGPRCPPGPARRGLADAHRGRQGCPWSSSKLQRQQALTMCAVDEAGDLVDLAGHASRRGLVWVRAIPSRQPPPASGSLPPHRRRKVPGLAQAEGKWPLW